MDKEKEIGARTKRAMEEMALEKVHPSKTYIKYLDEILQNNNIGFIYKENIDEQELEKLQKDYFIFSSKKWKMKNIHK